MMNTINDLFSEMHDDLFLEEMQLDKAIILEFSFIPYHIYPYLLNEFYTDLLEMVNKDRSRFFRYRGGHPSLFGVIHKESDNFLFADLYHEQEANALGGGIMDFWLGSTIDCSDFSLRRLLFTSATVIEALDFIEDLKDSDIEELVSSASYQVVGRVAPLVLSSSLRNVLEYFRQMDPFLARTMNPEEKYLVRQEVIQ